MVSLCARLLLQKRESLSSEVREKLVTGSKEEALARAGTKYVPEKSKLPTGAIVWLKFDGEKLSRFSISLSGQNVSIVFDQSTFLQTVLTEEDQNIQIRVEVPTSQIELADNSSVTSWGSLDQWAAKFSLPGGVQLVIKTFRSLKKADPNCKVNSPTAEETVQRTSDE